MFQKLRSDVLKRTRGHRSPARKRPSRSDGTPAEPQTTCFVRPRDSSHCTPDEGSNPCRYIGKTDRVIEPRSPQRMAVDLDVPSNAARVQTSSVDFQSSMPLGLSTNAEPMDPSLALLTSTAQESPVAGSEVAETTTASLEKLNAMMFPSEDPFAYPQQPLIGLTGGDVRQQLGFTGNSAYPDAMQFYIPDVFEDIEHQLLNCTNIAQTSSQQFPPAEMPKASGMPGLQCSQIHLNPQ